MPLPAAGRVLITDGAASSRHGIALEAREGVGLGVNADVHCAAVNGAGNVYVCDPMHGRLLVFHDPYPALR